MWSGYDLGINLPPYNSTFFTLKSSDTLLNANELPGLEMHNAHTLELCTEIGKY